MFSASAYSFRQKSRLAISLSWIGGYTNVIALVALGAVVSHATGNSTQLARGIANRDLTQIVAFGFLVGAFLIGAALSGCLTEMAQRRGWRSKYILPIGTEAILLAGFMGLLSWHAIRPVDPPTETNAGPQAFRIAGLAALAMGLQNATITKISGSVVRTTHLTGIITDLGLEGVQYLYWFTGKLSRSRRGRTRRLLRVSRRHPAALRLGLLLSIAGSFGFGAIAGTLAYSHWNARALLGPIAFLLWIIYVDWHSPIADIRELDLANDPDLRLEAALGTMLPPGVSLYRATVARGRTLAKHRAPDFQLWLDRVPQACRVAVLAISPLTRFDANAVLDLEAAAKRLRNSHRRLILSGVTSAQFKALHALRASGAMDVNDLCADLEFAIARAIGIIQELSEQNRG